MGWSTSGTLRRWMLSAGLWSRERKRGPYRKRRERKAHFGELVQLDGSFHGWLEERGPEGCLMNLVDDATGTTMCQLGKQETTWAAANLLRLWIEHYGVFPRSVHGREERLCSPRQRSGPTSRPGATDAVWALVRQAGHRHHRCQFAASQRSSGTQPGHASRWVDQETAA